LANAATLPTWRATLYYRGVAWTISYA
jgi:hypothetical protein